MKKRNILLLVLTFLLCFSASGQTVADRRAEKIGLGMNLSYLDNYWLGSKQVNFSDFMNPAEAARREKMLADIAAAGFATVRLPVCFGAWMEMKPPFDWIDEQGLKMADSFVKWALANKLNVIIDLHHTELDSTVPEADSTERVVNLWRRIAGRYRRTDPERVFFELRNEPHDITPEAWRQQAGEIIRVVREIAPEHTLIVGFHDWNGRQALLDSEPFADKNIIYTFHYYDPFIFTHQGATWSAEGLADVRGVPFPFSKKKSIRTPESAGGKWAGDLIKNYQTDSSAEKMFADLKAAKDWSRKNNVPIFLGEFGSYSKFAALEDRCRHAAVVYSALGKLGIPNAWWEWDGGFNMFEKGTNKIAPCMQKALDSYRTAKAGK